MDIKTQILKALGLSQEVKLGYQNKLEDGTIIVSTADELIAGSDVSIMAEDGSLIPLPVGEYTTEDGVGFSVTTEGTVAEIYEEEVADETAEDTEEVEAAEDEGTEDEATEEAPAAEEVVSVITDEVAAATEEIAVAIDEATGDEVTPEVAAAAAEIAIAIVEEKIDEVALNKQLKELTSALKSELNKISTRLSNVEGSAAGEPVSVSKFSNDKPVELSKAEYSKLSTKDRFFYNLAKSN